MSNEEQIAQLQGENYVLKERIRQLERLIFGARRERFVLPTSERQGSLFDLCATETAAVVEPPEVVVKNRKPKKPTAVKRGSFPARLRREIERIEPRLEQPEQWVEIGQDVTEVLAYVPADFYVKQTVRPRYAHQSEAERGIQQATIPPRLIPKGMLDTSVVSEVIIEKLQFHTPIHRFVRKLKLAGIDFIKQNTLHNALHRAAETLLPLYHLLQKEVLATAYVQADETHIRVLAKNKVGAAHRGQMWVYFAPTLRTTFFHYDPRRDEAAARTILDDYSGVLQCDGYGVYQKVGQSAAITLTHCWAHVRRKFFEAQASHPEVVPWLLEQIGRLYALERQARSEQLTCDGRQQLRQQSALPILEKIKTQLVEHAADPTILPKSMLNKAVRYTLSLWSGLVTYAHDGRLEIDNNLVENTIRPVALGRKNYLFAGSHAAAQNLAVLYSFIGSCEQNGINTRQYLNWVLDKLVGEKVTERAVDWLPHRVDQECFAVKV